MLCVGWEKKKKVKQSNKSGQLWTLLLPFKRGNNSSVPKPGKSFTRVCLQVNNKQREVVNLEILLETVATVLNEPQIIIRLRKRGTMSTGGAANKTEQGIWL